MKELRGRCAVVTGASRGIGRHVALALGEQGMSVVLAARDADGLEHTRAIVERIGARTLIVPTDLTSDEDLRRLIARSEAAFGAVDVLVNNAGVETFARYDVVERAEIEAAIRVNLLAPMLLTHLALPGMLARHRGHVVNVASLAGRFGLACMETYTATKGGLVGFTQSLRATYRGRGISASAICPGFVAEGGMYVRFQEAASQDAAAPGEGRQFRAVPAEAVGQAIVQAIVRDRPEAIVAPRPMRPLLAAAVLAPGVAERVVERLGLHDLIRRVARGETPAPSRAGTAQPASGGGMTLGRNAFSMPTQPKVDA